MDAVTGFDKTKNLLKEHFRNDFVIAEAYIHRVTQSSQLKASDRVKLLDFSDELRNCYETSFVVNKLNEVIISTARLSDLTFDLIHPQRRSTSVCQQ